MPRYKITLSFDVDEVPNFKTAERIARSAARQFEDNFSYIISPSIGGGPVTHNITNVEGHKPGIITNHDDPIYSD